MKLKIYDEKEEGIYLKLEERSNRIVVVAVKEQFIFVSLRNAGISKQIKKVV